MAGMIKYKPEDFKSKCFDCAKKSVYATIDRFSCSDPDCKLFSGFVPKKIDNVKTYADCVRSMTDEELAELFSNGNCGYCHIHDFCFAKGCQVNCEDVWLDWLKQEATK